ncbi:MAG: N-acetyl-gamma-glutamyl-phosphate reductase [bacterium]|nr:N-acetyl-gamma-glutamyl-phosphate reductase [bacterium]
MIRIGILGAKGYTAGELMRILAGHPRARLACLMARVEAPEPVAKYFPALRGIVALPIEPVDLSALAARCDAVFLALPHTTAQEYAPALIEKNVRPIDLSADFRFDSVELYEATYKVTHLAPQLNARIPYALPELFRAEIAGAPGLAIPGCYTTTSILALAPFMTRGEALDLDRIVINALSGVSGAGRSPTETTHFPECNESVAAYGVARHRHRPEIEEKLGRLAGRPIRLVFTPHLIPMNRGILVTCTIPMKRPVTIAEAHGWVREFYAGEPFVRVLPEGEVPATGAVALTNFCDIGVVADPHAAALVVISAADNLVKGASGQAVQAMNALFGLPETMGLLAANESD